MLLIPYASNDSFRVRHVQDICASSDRLRVGAHDNYDGSERAFRLVRHVLGAYVSSGRHQI